MMEEEWKNISEIKKYAHITHIKVSNYGNVYYSKMDKGKKIYHKKKQKKVNGYLSIQIGKKIRGLHVHRLVALLFLRDDYEQLKNESDKEPIVHHKHFDTLKQDYKLNNCVTNLEWVTESKHNEIHRELKSQEQSFFQQKLKNDVLRITLEI